MKKLLVLSFAIASLSACGSKHSDTSKSTAQLPGRYEKNDCGELLSQREQIVQDLNDGIEQIQHEGEEGSVPPSTIELSNSKLAAEAWLKSYDTLRCEELMPTAQGSLAVKKGIQEVGDYLDR
jgi:hypothetical protein